MHSSAQKLMFLTAFRTLCETWLADPDFLDLPYSLSGVSNMIMALIDSDPNQRIRDECQKTEKFAFRPPKTLIYGVIRHEIVKMSQNYSAVLGLFGEYMHVEKQIFSIAGDDVEKRHAVLNKAPRIIKALQKEKKGRRPMPDQCQSVTKCKTLEGAALTFRTGPNGLWNKSCAACNDYFRVSTSGISYSC